jgi:hypothetical protein
MNYNSTIDDKTNTYINAVWFNKLNKLKQYINDNKKLPTINGNKKIYNWYRLQRLRYNNKNIKSNIKFCKLWNEFLEEYYNYFKSDECIWIENLNKLKQYIDNNKKLPSRIAKNNECIQLAKWLHRQRNNYKNKIQNMKNKKIYNLWSEFDNEYAIYFKSIYELWNYNLNKLKQYINNNKKLPTCNTKNIDTTQLYTWLKHQLKNYKEITYIMKDKEIYDLWTEFNKEYYKYFTSKKNLWLCKLNKLKQFIHENKKMPSKNCKNYKLYKWVLYQKHNYNLRIKNMKDKEIYNLWYEFTKEYSEFIKLEENEKQKNIEEIQQKNIEEIQQKNIEEIQQKNIEEIQQKNIEEIQQKNIEEIQQENIEEIQQENIEEIQQKNIEEIQQEMQIETEKKVLNDEQINKIIQYCSKDINLHYNFYELYEYQLFLQQQRDKFMNTFDITKNNITIDIFNMENF